jgi:hypothetical protein
VVGEKNQEGTTKTDAAEKGRDRREEGRKWLIGEIGKKAHKKREARKGKARTRRWLCASLLLLVLGLGWR